MTGDAIDGIHLSVAAEGDGPPVLLLHGFTGRGSTWHDLVDMLSARHRTIAVDLLGHGASDAPTNPRRYGVDRQATDLAMLLERLTGAPADVLGYSMGARIAMRLAVDHPAVVRRLVLESPSLGIRDETERAARRSADEELARLLDHDGIDAFVDRWKAQPILATQRTLPADVRRRLRRERLANRPEGLAASLRGAGQGTAPPVGEELRGLAIPVLLICGSLDAVGRERAEQVHAMVDSARLEVIPGAGHAPHLERPAAFGAAVRAFLDDPPALTDPPLLDPRVPATRPASR
jgi:2-succinyl-6-hydroxy-2,4-cyclohexadiene-1-carboxylate synthase